MAMGVMGVGKAGRTGGWAWLGSWAAELWAVGLWGCGAAGLRGCGAALGAWGTKKPLLPCGGSGSPNNGRWTKGYFAPNRK
ncbi:hypothetical protein GMPD_08370 [Geomonas paludis]|uniref:Uncharacterized protein n=1 Tax=Geomonas paludis TaxID=2740185 RepID=A0A6V8MS20_9BACT|nr:hypothetical protein GMPD_08370 [Geomonas paludis]